MLEKLKAAFQYAAVSNISVYAFVRSNVGRFAFLLPHDTAFYAFKKVGDGERIFLDIGANDGISARSYRKLVANRAILSIEPNPHHEASLLRVKASIRNFSFMLIGAGAENGTMVLYTPIYKGVPLTNYASLDTETARRNLDTHMNIRDIGTNAEFSRNEIVIKRLDELDLDPAIIKIDVEGYEDIVISGLRETISKSRPMLMVEYNPRSYVSIKTILAALNYTPNAYDVSADRFVDFQDSAPSLNVFFLPKESAY